MRKKLLITSVVLALVAIIVTMVFANPNKPVFFRLRMLKEHAHLTDQQEEKIKGIIVENQKNQIDLKAQIEKKELEMTSLLMKEKPNRDAIIKLAREIGNLRTELHVNQIIMRLDIRNELTDEQWNQVKEMWQSEEHPRTPMMMQGNPPYHPHKGFKKQGYRMPYWQEYPGGTPQEPTSEEKE